MDRLSELPDEILCHILSFLPTETSVATSILARRWRFLWSYVPNLDFSDSRYYLYNPSIINKVLSMHKLSSLRSLSIDLLEKHVDCEEFEIETWILAAKDRNVEYFHLLVHYSKPLPFPLFTCKNLVGLRLYCCGEIPTLHDVCFPCLKKLDLQFVQFEDDDSLSCLLSASPVLEYLRVESYEDDEASMRPWCVSSPTLKWLCLNDLVGTDWTDIVEINTPALEYLFLRRTLTAPIESGDLTSLISVDIIYDKESEFLLKFLDTCCNVKCLRMKLIYTDADAGEDLLSLWTPSFNNLTELHLDADSRFLSKFLQSVNNLQILEFCETPGESDEVLNELTKGPQVPECLLSSLRTIKIYVYEEDNFEIIRYLLRSAQVLKRMDIAFLPRLHYRNHHLHQKISLFQRGSKTCEFAFTEANYFRPREISPWH